MRRILNLSLVSSSIVLISACGSLDKESSNKNAPLVQGRTGCVQGVVVDGHAGKPLALKPSADNTMGVSVLLRDHMLKAQPTSLDSSVNEQYSLNGEYHICGLPLDEEMPIFANVEGYQPFQSYIRIDSFVTYEHQDVEIQNPMQLANIRLFPIGTNARDISFKVKVNDELIEGAKVMLKNVGPNTAEKSSSKDDHDRFIAPVSTRQRAITGETDKEGNVVFKGEQLVLGGRYEWRVYPYQTDTDIVQLGQIDVESINVDLGLGGGTEPEVVNVSIKKTKPE